jgi:RNA recognition motif-containing protein
MKQERERSEGEHEIKDAEVDASVDQAGVENAVGVKVARRVYVGNLAWRTSWQDLKDHFGVVGEVRFADVLRSGMRSKGCGIVEYESASAAKAAIETLNHSMLDGRQVFVREDREDFDLKQSHGEVGNKKQYEASGVGEPKGNVVLGKKVWVGDLGGDVTWRELKDHFRGAGKVLHAHVLQYDDGTSKGCGVVEFESPSEALRAISLFSNSMLGDRAIIVREDREEGSMGQPLYSGRGDGAASFQKSLGRESCQIVVHGLPYKMSWQDLKDLVRDVARAPVIRADIMTTVDGLSKGYGVVVLSNQDDAQTVISYLHGRVVDGRVLTAKFDKFTRK